MDQGEGVEGADRGEDPLDFALWKARKEGRTPRGTRPVGRGRPGWHRVLGDGGDAARRRRSTSTAAERPDLPAPRERGRADAGRPRAATLARIWMHNGMSARGREDVEVGRQHPRAGEVLDEVGRDTLILYFGAGHYRQPLAFSRERLTRRGGWSGSATPAGGWCRATRRRSSPRSATRSSTRSRTTSTRRGARARSSGSARPTARGAPVGGRTCARCSSARAREAARGRRGGARRGRGPGRRAEAPRARATSPRPTGCATSCARAAGRSATAPEGAELVPDRGVIVYGRNAVRPGASAGPRRCARIMGERGAGRPARSRGWATPGAARPRREITAGAAAPTPTRACAPTSRSTATPTPPRCWRARAVDRRARRGHRPAEPRRRLPHRRVHRRDRRDPAGAPLGGGHAGGLQGVGGAVEHLAIARVRNLADFLRDAKTPGCWCYGAAAGARTGYRAVDWRGGVVLVLGAGGPRPATARGRDPATTSSRCRCAGASSRSTSAPPRRS